MFFSPLYTTLMISKVSITEPDNGAGQLPSQRHQHHSYNLFTCFYFLFTYSAFTVWPIRASNLSSVCLCLLRDGITQCPALLPCFSKLRKAYLILFVVGCLLCFVFETILFQKKKKKNYCSISV